MARTDPSRRRLVDAAVRAVGEGLFVFPVCSRGKTPAVVGWEAAATRDLDQVRRWWATRPYNIGAAVGRSRVLVVDLDVRRPQDTPPPEVGADCAGGREVLDLLARRHGEVVPETRQVRTPSGGTHLYFRMPDGVELRNTQGRLGWKIDTRGCGGFVVAAGSRRGTGRYVADDTDIAVLPGWLVEALTLPPPSADVVGSPVRLVRPSAVGAYVEAIVAGETQALADAAPGTKHASRLRAARALGRLVAGGELDAAFARRVLLEAAEGHVGGDTSRRKVEGDIDDGLAFGARRPRRISSRSTDPGRGDF